MAVTCGHRPLGGQDFTYLRRFVCRQEVFEHCDEVVIGQIPQLLAAAFGELDARAGQFVGVAEWDTVAYQLNSMWEGEYGPWLASIF